MHPPHPPFLLALQRGAGRRPGREMGSACERRGYQGLQQQASREGSSTIRRILRGTASAPTPHPHACSNLRTLGSRRRSPSWSVRCEKAGALHTSRHALAMMPLLMAQMLTRPCNFLRALAARPAGAGNACFHVHGSECSTSTCGTLASSSENARCAACSARASPGASCSSVAWLRLDTASGAQTPRPAARVRAGPPEAQMLLARKPPHCTPMIAHVHSPTSTARSRDGWAESATR